MQPIGLRAVVIVAILVLDVEQVELPRAEAFDADEGVMVGKCTRVDRVCIRVGVLILGRLDELWRRGKCPVRAVVIGREGARVIPGGKPFVGILGAFFERLLSRRVRRKGLPFSMPSVRKGSIIARSRSNHGSF